MITALSPLSPEQTLRYSRQILLREIGGAGQTRLGAASVFLLGAGGLGSPTAFYLAAAGVGELIIADSDRVELSNLQRQILHTTERIGRFKAESAALTLQALNPDVRITPIIQKITEATIRPAVANCTLIVDGSDNFPTRHLLNRVCLELHKPLVSGAILGFEAQIATFRHGVTPGAPCYACLYPPTASEQRDQPTCASAGVLGAVAGVAGSWMANEAIKELLGIGTGLEGSLLLLNLLDGLFHRVTIPRNPDCPVCAPRA